MSADRYAQLTHAKTIAMMDCLGHAALSVFMRDAASPGTQSCNIGVLKRTEGLSRSSSPGIQACTEPGAW